MTENQELKMQLLDKFANIEKPETVDFCKAAFNWLVTEPILAKSVVNGAQPDSKPDGIYLVMADGTAYLFDGEAPSETVVGNLKGIGVKQGSWALVVDLHDAANGEEIALTAKKDTTDYAGYIDNYVDAVADWNGKANTEHLKDIGLNKDIELKDGQYIPALGEMYFVYMNLKAINAALEFVGGTPIERDWYWTSTEFSATYAWYLNLYSGYASYSPKASYTLRVRPVSAFIS